MCGIGSADQNGAPGSFAGRAGNHQPGRQSGCLLPAPHGFTLTELLSTLTILSLLTMVAAPGLFGSSARQDADAASNHLYRALQHARSEAKRRSARLQVCGSDDGRVCSRIWRETLLLFDDANDNGEADTGEILQFYPVGAHHSEVQTRLGFARKAVTFDSLGHANLTGSFLLCDRNGESAPLRKITWNAIGRPYSLNTPQQVANHSSMTCL